MKHVVTGLCIVICLSSYGQGTNNLKLLNDSLIFQFEINRKDSVRAAIMLQLAENLMYSNPDSAIYYGEKALQLAENENLEQIQVGALGFIGNTLMNGGDLPRALELGFQAIEMAKDLPVRVAGIGPTYDNMGWIYHMIGDYEKALFYFTKMIKMGKSDEVGVAFGYKNIAMVYEKLNMLDSAMIYLDKSMQKFITINHSFFPTVYHVTPGWYNLRARIYLKQNKPALVKKDLFTTLRMTMQNDEPYHTANTYNDIAMYYKHFNEFDSIIYYAEKGLAEAGRISYSEGVLQASEMLAEQYEKVDPLKALFYHKLATKTRDGIYGAGNIQIMKDMIAQNEKKQRDLEAAAIASRNQIRLNTLLGSLFTLLVVALLLFRNNRMKQKAKQNIQIAFDQLKATQTQLIHSEKMASLGELTAGIAHEIQNPLNFVNNFSEVSEDLINEMLEDLSKGNEEEVMEIISDLQQNLQKINNHGKRASEIVKGMLQHSRGSEGKKEPTDINLLADEYMRLAFHGMRAKDKTFNAEYVLNLDESLPKINVVPQDIGRVLLNLINNAFYAVAEAQKANENTVTEASRGVSEPVEGKKSEESESHDSTGSALTTGDYKPEVVMSTRQFDGNIEIRISDNGPGIPEQVRDKIFQPFFTTKPTGQGTGLGLSLSYDIITKGHGGSLEVQCMEGKGTEFIIRLPIV